MTQNALALVFRCFRRGWGYIFDGFSGLGHRHARQSVGQSLIYRFDRNDFQALDNVAWNLDEVFLVFVRDQNFLNAAA